MTWRLSIAPVLLAAMIGCAKRNADGEIQDREALFTLKIAPKKEGETYEVKDTQTSTITTKPAGSKAKDETQTSRQQLEYTEAIQDFPADSLLPTKLLRTYTTANQATGDKLQKLTYAGKSVQIEKQGTRYAFIVQGGLLLPP